MKISTAALLVGGGIIAWYYLEKGGTMKPSASQSSSSGLPSDAVPVQSVAVGSLQGEIYMAPTGYYLAALNSQGAPVKVWGPFSQSQVYLALQAQNILSGL
jgi:glucan-binding YG repeat protein